MRYKLFNTLLIIFSVSSCAQLSSQFAGLTTPKERPTGEDGFFPIWIKNLDPIYKTGNLPIALNSPIIGKGMVFSGDPERRMVAYDLTDGRPVWKSRDNGGYHGVPVIFKKQLIYGTIEGRVYSRSYKSGKIKWAVDLGTSVEGQGAVKDGRIFFHTRNHKIFALDGETGKVLWAYKRSIPFLTTLQRVSEPVVVGERLYVGLADGHVACLNMHTGVLLWERRVASGPRFVDIDSKPLFFGQRLFLSSLAGNLTMVDPKNGALLRRLPYSLSRAPIKVGEFLFLGTVDGELAILDKNLKEIKKVEISKFPISSMVNWGQHIAVATAGSELFLINPLKLNVVSTHNFGHSSSAVLGEMSVYGKHLAVMSSRNRLYLFEKKPYQGRATSSR